VLPHTSFTAQAKMATKLAEALLARDRAALSRAITLAESRAPRHREAINTMLNALLPRRAGLRSSLRIGISGPPGAGKSTLIEALGNELLSRGNALAVLAIDPSSSRSGGSILGDKTRMPTLAADRRAFVRPSPTRGALGGVARRTEDAILLCECAGYDRVIVETVGVGQSEVAVAGMVDVFVLLVPPAAGDELQGIKRGIMELADIVIVTKADGPLRAAAGKAASQLRSALKVMQPRSPHWNTRVLQVSALSQLRAPQPQFDIGGETGDDDESGSGDGESGSGDAPKDGTGARDGAGARASDSTKLDSGPTKLDSGPTKLDSDSTKLDSGPTKLDSGRSKRRAAALVESVATVADCLDEFQAVMTAAGAHTRRREAQATLSVRTHALAALLERLGEEGEVEALVRTLAAQTARGTLAASQAGALIAARVLGGGAPLRPSLEAAKAIRSDLT
jgi:LAO/AO transport system kinase